MNITVAIIFVDDVAKIRIEGDSLVNCEDPSNLDYDRQILEQAFMQILNVDKVECLFPELGECIDDTH